MLGLLPLAVARPFVGVLLWSWVSFMSPQREIWSFAAGLPWAAMVIAATAVGCVIAREPKKFEVNAVTALILALALCFTLTTLAGQAPDEIALVRYDRAIKVLIGLLLTASLLTDRWRIHALVWIMVVSIAFFSFKGGIFTIMNAGSYRIYGPAATVIGDNNHFGAAMLVTLPLMYYLYLQSQHRIVRQIMMAVLLLTLISVIGTYSRGALLGLVAAGGIFWLRSKHKVILGVVMVGCLAGAASTMPAGWLDRMHTIQTYDQDASASERLVLWEISWKLALNRPLLGSGFGGPYSREVVDKVAPGGPARAVHSIWFELLGEHGFPTFFVWVGLTVAGVVYSFRLIQLARDRPDLAWAGDLARMSQISIVAYLVSGTFLSLSYWDFYWTILVVLAATYRVVQRKVDAEERASRWRNQQTTRKSWGEPSPEPVAARQGGHA